MLREDRDIFGFEGRKSKRTVVGGSSGDKPISHIHCDVVIEFLMSKPLEGLFPISEFSNQIRWGGQHGAIKMVVSPLGSYKSIIRRLQPDLEGNEVWACKRIIPYKEILDVDIVMDEKVGWLLYEQMEQVRKEEIQAPSRDYQGLRSLTHKAARHFQKNGIMPEVFVYRGIKEVKPQRNYLIVYEMRGHGVEAPGSARVEQFVIDMSYNPNTGMIRSFGHDVQSPTKGHVWRPQPSEWDEYFSSSQPDSEIVDCVAGAFSTY